MEFHRRRSPGAPVAWLAVGAAVMVTAAGSTGALVFGGLIALAALVQLIAVLRPVGIRIERDGLEMRRDGHRRLVAWSEFERLALVGPPPFVLLEVRGGMPARRLLDFGAVKEAPAAAAELLTRYAGARFEDQRVPVVEQGVGFTVVLRGYDRAQVEELIRRVAAAPDRGAAAAIVDGASIVVVLRGYDRTQVDAHLRALAER